MLLTQKMTWATELTAEQVKNIFLVEGNIKKWSDIDP